MIPTEKELIDFIKKKDLLNFSTITKLYNINNATVSDLIEYLIKKKIVIIRKIGANKIVRLI